MKNIKHFYQYERKQRQSKKEKQEYSSRNRQKHIDLLKNLLSKANVNRSSSPQSNRRYSPSCKLVLNTNLLNLKDVRKMHDLKKQYLNQSDYRSKSRNKSKRNASNPRSSKKKQLFSTHFTKKPKKKNFSNKIIGLKTKINDLMTNSSNSKKSSKYIQKSKRMQAITRLNVFDYSPISYFHRRYQVKRLILDYKTTSLA